MLHPIMYGKTPLACCLRIASSRALILTLHTLHSTPTHSPFCYLGKVRPCLQRCKHCAGERRGLLASCPPYAPCLVHYDNVCTHRSAWRLPCTTCLARQILRWVNSQDDFALGVAILSTLMHHAAQLSAPCTAGMQGSSCQMQDCANEILHLP